VLAQADLRIANLECVLADDGRPWPGKVFHFRSDTKNVACLTRAGIDLVSLANNHVLDYGTAAFEQMLGTLDRAGVRHAGAGLDADSARMPAVWRTGELTVGFIAVTDNEPGWEAGPGHPGVYYLPIDEIDVVGPGDPRTTDLVRLVRETSRQVDLLIVSAHWGGNWGRAGPAAHRVLAHALIDAGAGVVFGHSPHIVRPVEVYRGRPVIYSAGDFIDDYAIDPVERNDQSFIFVLETEGAVLRSLRLHPTLIDGFQARLAGAGARAIARRLDQGNASFGTRSRWLVDQTCLEIPLGETD
jgi:poly-gamma-glutamate synthesis protein (capsule biosynthesis protein)